LLDQVGVPYHIEPRMVRGLDYYVRTAFEVTAAGLGAQNAVGGGGRYDGLVAELGGPEMPGVGFALGVERLFLAMGAAQEQREETPDLLLLPLDAEAELRALELARRWRQEGLRVDLGSSERSLKSQMRAAGKQGVRVVAIIGEAERAANAATVRDMVGKRDLPRALPFHWNADAVRLFLADLETAEPALPAG
jgi:histidyl-tRNA synthetase